MLEWWNNAMRNVLADIFLSSTYYSVNKIGVWLQQVWKKCNIKIGNCDRHQDCSCFRFHQACVLQRQRKGSVSSDASASTDSNTYYEDDFSSTEEDSSQGILLLWINLDLASLKLKVHARVCTHIAALGLQNKKKKIITTGCSLHS